MRRGMLQFGFSYHLTLGACVADSSPYLFVFFGRSVNFLMPLSLSRHRRNAIIKWCIDSVPYKMTNTKSTDRRTGCCSQEIFTKRADFSPSTGVGSALRCYDITMKKLLVCRTLNHLPAQDQIEMQPTFNQLTIFSPKKKRLEKCNENTRDGK